jgi:ElaB/YqjD/DUF883 family membrane-anchored ribosome-binding protein
MTSTNEAFRRAANSPTARQATETARNMGEEVSDFASDVSRKAGKQFDRAQDMAVDAMNDASDAMQRYPITTIAVAAGLGFLLGAFAMARR